MSNTTKEYCDILIISASYGGGHNQVAKALSQEIQAQEPGLNIITIDYCDLLYPFLSRFTQFSYSQSIRHFPVGYALYYQATENISPDSFWQRRLNRIGYSELIMLVNRLRPQIIISTFPLPAGVLSRMKETGDLSIPIVTVITDYSVHSQWVHPYTDLYLVGSEEMVAGLIKRGISSSLIAVSGIPILSAFNQSHDTKRIKEELGCLPGDRLIIFMGGYDGIFGTTRFGNVLKDLPVDVKAIIITGANEELYEKLETVKHKYSNLKVFKYIENIPALMEASEILITKAGGITISEALAKGLPMVIYKPSPGQEEANARYLWLHRAAIIAKGERRLKSAMLKMLSDKNFRERFRRNELKIGKPNSAAVSASLILKLMRTKSKAINYYRVSRREIRA